jgi:hypothetical protein
MSRLREEGFTTDQSEEEWEQYGEIIFHREEKISFAEGETVFIFTKVDDLNEGILKQTSESVVNTYKAKNPAQKALSVLQSTTVYHCLVAPGDMPHNELLSEYVRRQMGATFIPVVMVPEINEREHAQADHAGDVDLTRRDRGAGAADRGVADTAWLARIVR